MAKHEVPSDNEVVATLGEIGGCADALALCKALMEKGHPRLESQLAIQRAAERGRLRVLHDWRLEVSQEAMAA